MRHMLLMLIAILLASIFLPPTVPADLSQGYGIWVSVDRGSCIYWLTDAGLDARQLTETLKEHGYEAGRGADIILDDVVPARCIRDAERAVRRAGFTDVRVRPGTEKDRMHGIP